MVTDTMSSIFLYMILFLPLTGWLLASLLRRTTHRIVIWITCATVLGSFITSLIISPKLLDGMVCNAKLINWLSLPGYRFSLGLMADKLTLLMMVMITGVGFLVHMYSIGYMADDREKNRYFSYLNLFIFFMLFLVMSDSLIGTFIGWEGVGLCSYLLIGFWNTSPANIAAASKAFIMNRIGDIGFMVAMGVLLAAISTLNYSEIIAHLPDLLTQPTILFVVTLGLIIAVAGKSAQFPLYTWLPDAMAGPTPVSALIHAATMVTAGIYLVSRLSVLFYAAPYSAINLLWMGIATAFIGGVAAVVQFDLKKIFAYSTVSQLGLMVIALGLGQVKFALFHMLMHAFFKALLFLGSGNIIHALHGEQDIRNMGGLAKSLPFTATAMGIGALAMMGLPPLSGFYSKDAILEVATHHAGISYLLIILSCLTVFYLSRTLYFVFLGTPRMSTVTPHEGTLSMQIPIAILGFLAVVGGWITHNLFLAPGIEISHLQLVITSLVIIGVIAPMGFAWAKRQLHDHENSPRVCHSSRFYMTPLL